MTKAHSSLGDNGGRCERCDRPESAQESQSQVPVKLGGGLGAGTMWVCNSCFENPQRQKEEPESGAGRPLITEDMLRFHTRKHTPDFMNTARDWDKRCNAREGVGDFYLDLVFICFNTLMAVEAWEGIDNVLEAETMFLYDSSTELILAVLTALHWVAKQPGCKITKYAKYREEAFRVLKERDPENFPELTFRL